MAFVRLRKVDGKYYASLVHNKRDGKKVCQQVLQNYGRVHRGLFRRLLKRKPSKMEIDRAVEKGRE